MSGTAVPASDRDLDGRTAIVTGAGRNLGRAIALELGRRGAAVAVNVRSSIEEADAVCAAIRAAGSPAVAVVGDVGSEWDIERIVDEARAQLGPVTIAVSNAAARSNVSFDELTPHEWRRIVDVDLSAPFHLFRQVVGDMRAAGFGRIVAITGINAHRVPTPRGVVHVAAAKAGVEGLVRALSRELGAHGITANAIAPGPIATVPGKDKHYRTYVGRIGEPSDIAFLAGMLCSPAAGYLSGQVVVADGGGMIMLDPDA